MNLIFMVIITGAAGFIGSFFAKYLNEKGIKDLILVDDFSREDKLPNLKGIEHLGWVHRDAFIAWLPSNYQNITAIFHIGARTDTTEFDTAIFDRLNLHYTQNLWKLCTKYQIPLVYASSAATYGLGELGYEDRHDIVEQLQPLNAYGRSKNDFDKWALQQTASPPMWYGLKFFNVYGPNEYHKGRMASVIFHAFRQIQETDKMKLFRSHNPNFEDGKQLRDFVYVKDVAKVMYFLLQQIPASGLYNLGTGQARTFLDLVTNTFAALDKTPYIEFIDTPMDIRDKYQYFTEANMAKLKEAGYDEVFYSLEEGVKDYVQNYLLKR
ncbi:MAG: ADP-glyceromanno-heptose 6-epimerase [Chitinophagales bacterium]